MKQIVCDACGYVLKRKDHRFSIEISDYDANEVIELDLCEQCYNRVKKAVNLIPSDCKATETGGIE